MSKEELHISGVFNYCDRWCERCPLTARCRLFEMSEESFPDAESRDINNQAFWDALGKVFQDTLRMVRDMARERGVDLDAMDGEDLVRDSKQRFDGAQEHPLAVEALGYADAVSQWFDNRQPQLEEKEDDLNRQLQIELPGADPEGEAIRIGDAIEVVRWYQYQIGVKLIRALSGDPEFDEGPSDSDGSAKVSLLGTDRSLAAWTILRESFPEDADVILDLLVRLDRLRRKVEALFPNARAFVRPGFDAPAE